MKHTLEPWALHPIHTNKQPYGWGINGTKNDGKDFTGRICDVPLNVPCFSKETQEANAERIIACVNACQGFTTERLETITKEGESLLIRFNRLQERLERLEEHWTTHDNPKH